MFEVQIHYRFAKLFSSVVSCKTVILWKVILRVHDQTGQTISLPPLRRVTILPITVPLRLNPL